MKKKASLKSVAHLLLEDGAPINPSDPQPLPLEVQNISLDMSVDNYLMKYEKESLPTQQNYQVPGSDLGVPGGTISAPPGSPPGGTGLRQGGPVNGVQMPESLFKKTMFRLLEAEGDDPMAGGDDPTADAGAPPGDDAAPPAGAPEAPAVENPRFNVKNFAESVARLVLNYEGLLDPRTTIMNRARAYIEKNYDGGVARQMMEILKTQFQLSPRDPQEIGTNPATPIASGAWTGVGGGGGG
jgi:hypothetical protein